MIGNRNSNVYHLPVGCPSYGKVGTRNRVEFASAADAEAAGFKRAGNCR
ncbi:sunset domain-containing protein [Pseudomonas brenneri]